MSFILILACLVCVSAAPHSQEVVLEDFDNGALAENVLLNTAAVSFVERGGGKALQVHFDKSDWPNIFFKAPEGGWDWSAHAAIAVDITNPEEHAVTVCMRIDNPGYHADGTEKWLTQRWSVRPGTATYTTYLVTDPGPFWGMRGVPVLGPIASGKSIDTSAVSAFQIFLPRPEQAHTLIIDNIRLVGPGGELEELVPMPFIDRFGQYMHDDWPGKVFDERELKDRAAAERTTLDNQPALAGRDEYGGWADGPKLEATGYFRAEQVDGKWWLITPKGTLFFSLGMDCVGTWSTTFVEGRDKWFADLPDPGGDSPLAKFYSKQCCAHSMADIIGGEGRVYGFYGANLLRKYGDDWNAQWRNMTYDRLRAWGFNTIANWSQHDVVENSPMPFVATANIADSVRRIEGGGGYWNKMQDVFDPGFAEAVEKGVGGAARHRAQNPLCIGFYVDNELAWGNIPQGALASPPDQPCREAFVADLKAKYGTLGELGSAWNVAAADWDSLRAPGELTEAARHDFEAFVYKFAHRYFSTVRGVIKQHAPNHLYLGCRFAGPAEDTVMRACADVVDVISLNLYYTALDYDEWTKERDYGKPVIIGEFHFGALDRGMFHTGLQAVGSQEERGEAYARYVRSVAALPSFVGCHWFQYVDEPTTGRWFDGENYNIGFVSVTDTPYKELVNAAGEVHAGVYEYRMK